MKQTEGAKITASLMSSVSGYSPALVQVICYIQVVFPTFS